MEERGQITKSISGSRIRRAGLILGLIGAGAGIPLSFVSCLGSWESPFRPELAYFWFSWMMHWAILLAAYIRPLIGGLLLIIDSSLLATLFFLPHLFYLPYFAYFPLDLMGLGLFLPTDLPLLASGVLFVLSWGKGRKRGEA